MTVIETQIVSIETWNTVKIITSNRNTHLQDIQITERVKRVNETLYETCTHLNIELIRFNKYMSKKRGRGAKRSTRYTVDTKLLKDGIHPGTLLSKAWTKTLQVNIANNCFIHTEENDILRLEPNSSESEDF